MLFLQVQLKCEGRDEYHVSAWTYRLTEHADENSAAPGEVQPVSGAVVNSHRGYVALNRCLGTKIARFRKAQSGSDSQLCSHIAQGVQPAAEFFGLADDEHISIVSDWIQGASDTCIARWLLFKRTATPKAATAQ